MPIAEIVEWRERKIVGLSNTLYRGLYLRDGMLTVLVTKLSHGYRVLQFELGKYVLYGSPGGNRKVQVSESFVADVRLAFEADLKFQAQIKDEYTRLMS